LFVIDTYQEMNSHYLHAIFRKNDGAGAGSVAHWRQVAKEAALLVSTRGIVDMYKKKKVVRQRVLKSSIRLQGLFLPEELCWRAFRLIPRPADSSLNVQKSSSEKVCFQTLNVFFFILERLVVPRFCRYSWSNQKFRLAK